MILQRVSPVTHSIGNCVKRVVVIAASVVFFRNPVSMQNALGECGALRWQADLHVATKEKSKMTHEQATAALGVRRRENLVRVL